MNAAFGSDEILDLRLPQGLLDMPAPDMKMHAFSTKCNEKEMGAVQRWDRCDVQASKPTKVMSGVLKIRAITCKRGQSSTQHNTRGEWRHLAAFHVSSIDKNHFLLLRKKYNLIVSVAITVRK